MNRVDASRTKSIIQDCSHFDRLCLFASSCMFAFSRNVELSVVGFNLKKEDTKMQVSISFNNLILN